MLFYLLYILLVGLNKVPQKKTLRKELVQKGFVKKMLPKKTSKKRDEGRRKEKKSRRGIIQAKSQTQPDPPGKFRRINSFWVIPT